MDEIEEKKESPVKTRNMHKHVASSLTQRAETLHSSNQQQFMKKKTKRMGGRNFPGPLAAQLASVNSVTLSHLRRKTGYSLSTMHLPLTENMSASIRQALSRKPKRETSKPESKQKRREKEMRIEEQFRLMEENEKRQF